jgi:AraC-like DNA-binding protein
LAKIAAELELAVSRRRVTGEPGQATPRKLAQGDGWSVSDVLCTSDASDHAFEERHVSVCIAVVVAGTFQYRAATPRGGRDGELMTPGSLLLGNAGQCFECGHEHGAGDRCVSFKFAPEFFARLASDAGVPAPPNRAFRIPRLPPLRALSPIVSTAALALLGADTMAWDEIAVRLAAGALRTASGASGRNTPAPAGAASRVTPVVREIERTPAASRTLAEMANMAGLSEFHFLRVFQRLTGVTPHQYLLRARLRDAALRLATGNAPVLDVAFDAGFGDVSNFNRAFRAEFNLSPRAYRRLA